MSVATADPETTRSSTQEQRSVSGQFADFICGVSFDTLASTVVESAKLRVLDCLATALASDGLEVPAVVRRFIRGSSGLATVFGSVERVAPVDAAFVNATLVNARSQDDFLLKSHPGALTLPAALAVAEMQDSSGAELLAALVVGYEMVGRVYLGGPTMLPRFRASGVVGTVAAAASAAKLLKLDNPRVMHALGLAACFSHGFGQGFMSGTSEVKINVGMASRSGVTAALLASHGGTASALEFEGDSGLYQAVSNTVDDVAQATQGLGTRYLIEDTLYKECPVCMLNQTPIALARELGRQVNLPEIAKVVVQAPELTYTNPGFTIVAPYTSHLQAVVSARFCVAAALLGRPMESYAAYDGLDDPAVLEMAEKIELVMRPEDSENVEVEIVLASGASLRLKGVELETMQPTQVKILSKFRRLTAGQPGVDAERVIERVMRLDRLAHVCELTSLLRGA